MRLPSPHLRDGRASGSHTGKRAALLAAALLALCALTGCAALQSLTAEAPATAQTVGGPNLSLLELPAYDDPDATGTEASSEGAEYMPVDLWLDATQTMGGINVNEASMYPHMGKKYREGGFHYHYGAQTGWYESLLRDFLAAAGETHVRALRYGNETLPDSFLHSFGLDEESGASASSIWRDLHTVATDADERLFSQFSAEDMSGSFYALGAPAWLNRISALDTTALENPALAPLMAEALNAQAQAMADGETGFTLSGGTDNAQCAFLTALTHIDVNRLSVITVDPASLRKLSGADASGQPVAFYEQALRALGVFDRGLCVGVLDFKLDYLGQMSSFTTATLSEPLVWGRVILDEKKQTFERLGVMPRRLMTLVIGTRARVNGFIDHLTEAIDGDRSLKGLRGPENGELTYAADGETMTQQPFTFEWNHTVIARPGMGYYTQHTEGATLKAADSATVASTASAADTAAPTSTANTASVTDTATVADTAVATDTATPAVTATATDTAATQDGGASVTAAPGKDGLPLLTFTAGANGAQPDRVLTLRLPIEQSADGAKLDVSKLTGAKIEPLYSLLLTQTFANTPLGAAGKGGQVIAYRDTLYRFTPGMDAAAFTLESVKREDDFLVCRVAVQGSLLKPGFYRLRVAADATGDQVAWESVPWIDGEQSVSTSVTDAEVYAWETFTAAATEFDRDTKGLPKMFQHAWGSYTDKLYHGLRVPDFPPVYLSVGLADLAAQLRAAAASDTSALIRYAFEVRVESD